jgi:hypothetical protein
MPRKPSDQPWLHGESGFWCDRPRQARVPGQRPSRRLPQAEGAPSKWLDASFAELADEYLTDVHARTKKDTYDCLRYRLLPALKIISPDSARR